MSLNTECTCNWHGLHLVPVISQTNAFLDIVQPKGEHTQPTEKSLVATYLSYRLLHRNSHQTSVPCSQINETAACRSEGGPGTLSEAAELKWSIEEYKDIRILALDFTLPSTSLCYELSGCNWMTHEWVWPERVIGRVWSFGSQCCASCHDRKGVCTCHQDAQTYPTGSLANTPSNVLYVPGWGWCYTEIETLRCLYIHLWRSHCIDGRQTDYRHISAAHERVQCS